MKYKVLFEDKVTEKQTITFEDLTHFRKIAFIGRHNINGTIINTSENFIYNRFQTYSIGTSANAIASLLGTIKSPTTASIDLIFNSSSLSDSNCLKIIGYY